MKISTAKLVGSWRKTGQKDRKKEVKEVEEIWEVKDRRREPGHATVRLGDAEAMPCRRKSRFSGVLNCSSEKTNGATREKIVGRRESARR
jgi:hypothetical protein